MAREQVVAGRAVKGRAVVAGGDGSRAGGGGAHGDGGRSRWVTGRAVKGNKRLSGRGLGFRGCEQRNLERSDSWSLATDSCRLSKVWNIVHI